MLGVRIRNRFDWLLAAMLAATVGVASAPAPQRRGHVGVRPEVIFAADANFPTLVFKITNDGRQPVSEGGFLTNTNRLVVLSPAGRVREWYTVVDAFENDDGRAIAPGQSKAWEVRVRDLPVWDWFRETGTYRMYWQFGETRSAEFQVDKRLAAQPEARRPERRAPDRLDRSMPVLAVKALSVALDAVDIAAAHEALYSRDHDSAEREVSGAFTQRLLAALGLQTRAKLRFGAGAFVNVRLVPEWNLLEGLDNARVRVGPYFDEATVEVPGRRFLLVREQDRWRVSVRSFFRDGKPSAADFRRRTDAIRETGEDIEAGRFGSPEEALKELRRRLDAEPSAAADPMKTLEFDAPD